MTPRELSVLLCDWHGKLVWKSAKGDRVQVGDFVWKNASKRSRERMRSAVASVATLRENCIVEVDNERNEHFRVWMWPLDEPDIAICALAMRIPSELALLTEREKECLRLLAQGKSTRDVARHLEIGLTTVHTHLRRIRDKLKLDSPEALVSFAARNFYVPPQAEAADFEARKRSG